VAPFSLLAVPLAARVDRVIEAYGGSLEFVTTFSDHRKVSGTWVAFLAEAPTGAFRP
jgi:hypothetical protein